MFNKITFILFCILLGIEFNQAENYKTCDTHSPDCPVFTVCSQRDNSGPNGADGDCKCSENFEFNPNHQNDSDYCIRKPVMQPTTSAISGGQKQHQEINNLDKTASAVSLNQPPTSHSIVGGILIPIFLVFIIIGLAYGIKRLHVIKRVRDAMAARRSRPFYEDVMMSNDNDDPPLI